MDQTHSARYHKKHRIHLGIQIMLFPVLIILDQLTKYLARIHLYQQPDIPFIKDAVIFRYVENPGAAFGILADVPWLFYVIAGIVICVVIFVILRMNRRLRIYLDSAEVINKKTLLQVIILNYLLVFLAAGAIGNLIDRIWHGYVIDFIYLSFMQFPVFNLADIFVTVTAVLLIIFFIFIYKEDDAFKRIR